MLAPATNKCAYQLPALLKPLTRLHYLIHPAYSLRPAMGLLGPYWEVISVQPLSRVSLFSMYKPECAVSLQISCQAANTHAHTCCHCRI